MGTGNLNHARELFVAFFTFANIPRVNTILRQHGCTIRVVCQQFVSVEMKVTDQGNITVGFIKGFPNMRHCCRRLGRVDGDADQFGAGSGQLKDLLGSRGHICGIGVGHGLHHDGSMTTDSDIAYLDGNRRMAV